MQKFAVQEYLSHRVYSSVELFDDAGYSGASTSRPELKRLMKKAKERKIDTVVVYKLDRWFRSLRETVITLGELTELGVAFVSLQDGVDLTTATGRLMANMLSSFAEFERELIGERVRAGMAKARANGKKFGAKRKDLDLTEAKRLLAEGKSYGETAKLTGLQASTIYRRLNPKAKATE